MKKNLLFITFLIIGKTILAQTNVTAKEFCVGTWINTKNNFFISFYENKQYSIFNEKQKKVFTGSYRTKGMDIFIDNGIIENKLTLIDKYETTCKCIYILADNKKLLTYSKSL